MKTTQVHTESGTRYSIRQRDGVAEVRREGGLDMRGDERWLKAYVMPTPVVGEPMVFVLEGLGVLPFTERTTSPVVAIKER